MKKWGSTLQKICHFSSSIFLKGHSTFFPEIYIFPLVSQDFSSYGPILSRRHFVIFYHYNVRAKSCKPHLTDIIPSDGVSTLNSILEYTYGNYREGCLHSEEFRRFFPTAGCQNFQYTCSNDDIAKIWSSRVIKNDRSLQKICCVRFFNF